MTYEEIANLIENVRYVPYTAGDKDRIQFDINNQTITIANPNDVVLVGADEILAKKWIAERWGWFLQLYVD